MVAEAGNGNAVGGSWYAETKSTPIRAVGAAGEGPRDHRSVRNGLAGMLIYNYSTLILGLGEA
ncbi:hypothetical protein GCM10027275_12480 [Rhabdobacter roseus]